MRQTPPHHLEYRGSRKGRATPLLTLRAFVAYKKGESLPDYSFLFYGRYIVTIFNFWKGNIPCRYCLLFVVVLCNLQVHQFYNFDIQT